MRYTDVIVPLLLATVSIACAPHPPPDHAAEEVK